MKIINVMASSLDGKIAAFPQETDDERRRYGFLIPEDQQLLDDELSRADAIITGGNSLRVTGTVSVIPNAGRTPTWVILSNHPDDFDLKFWNQRDVERIVVSMKPTRAAQDHSSKPNLKFLNYGTEHPATFIVNHLKAKGCRSVLLFGGGQINRLFYESGLVDELKLTLCPFIFAGLSSPSLVTHGVPLNVKFSLIASHPTGSHVFLHYRVHQ
jgi:5-amino-6-(5-phosphoribosylamino)uracil reductase